MLHVCADLQFPFLLCDSFESAATQVGTLPAPMNYDSPTLLLVVGLRVQGFPVGLFTTLSLCTVLLLLCARALIWQPSALKLYCLLFSACAVRPTSLTDTV